MNIHKEHSCTRNQTKLHVLIPQLLIPVTQVASLQKERTAKIIPNAVGLQMLDGKNYVFGSLLSRDSTYKLMLHIWRKAQRMADSDSEPPSGVQVVSVSGSCIFPYPNYEVNLNDRICKSKMQNYLISFSSILSPRLQRMMVKIQCQGVQTAS